MSRGPTNAASMGGRIGDLDGAGGRRLGMDGDGGGGGGGVEIGDFFGLGGLDNLDGGG